MVNAVILLFMLIWLHVRYVSLAETNCVTAVLRRELAENKVEKDYLGVIRLQVSGIWSHLEMEDAKSLEKLTKVMSSSDGTVAPNLFKVWLLDPVFVYSSERAFLMLDEATRQKFGINETLVRLNTEKECFSGHWSSEWERYLLDNFVGYDTVVLNSFGALFQSKGYLYSVHSRELFNVAHVSHTTRSSVAFKIGAMATTLFLFFITTTLVHHTLRETQERMLKFTYDLQIYVRRGLSYQNLVLNHVVGSLVFVPVMVGILFFLFEFYNDQLLAFMILAMVWVCELFSVITLRTYHNVRVFPRLFFLYFCSFHLYFFLFPSGFSYMALTCCVVFLQHAMLSFFVRYEMPALLSGRISSVRRRDVTRELLPEEVAASGASLAVRALAGTRLTTSSNSLSAGVLVPGTSLSLLSPMVVVSAASAAAESAVASAMSSAPIPNAKSPPTSRDRSSSTNSASGGFNPRPARKKRTTLHTEPEKFDEVTIILPVSVAVAPPSLQAQPPLSVGPSRWLEEDDSSSVSGWEIGGS